MSLLIDQIENRKKTSGKSYSVPFTNCKRCDREIYSLSNVCYGWLCLDCSADVRRGGVVIKDYDAKPEEQIVNDLILACEAALLLRGITAAINDPLALRGEKEKYRKRYQEIECQILGAIENAKELKK